MNLNYYKQIKFLCMLFLCSLIPHIITAQNPKITIDYKNVSLKIVLEDIEKQVGRTFFYEDDLINLKENINISMKDADLKQIIDKIFEGGISYSIVNQHIVLRKTTATPVVAPAAPNTISSVPPVATKTEEQVNQQPATKKVTGIVSSEGGPLVGAIVMLQGDSRNFTATGLDGSYSIIVPQSETTTLLFSFFGTEPTALVVGDRTVLNVDLKGESAIELEAVVVTGFREISAQDYTGAATILSSSKMETRGVATIEEALRGLDPGIIVAATGQPGEQNEVRLRGIGSMEAGSQPLYVIDGVILDQSSMSGDEYSPSNPLASLNPSDIANVSILKDAASAALYGSRGANGVIVITTKSGRENEATNYTLNLQTGMAVMRNYPELVNGTQYAELWTEGQLHYLIQQQLAVDGLSGRTELIEELNQLYGDKNGYTFHGMNYNHWMKKARNDFNSLYAIPVSGGGHLYYDYFGADADKLPATDWFKEIARVAPFMKVNLSMQGGSKTLRHYASLEYFDQQGTIINSQFKRYSGRFKLSSESDKYIVNWGINTNITYSMQSGPRAGGEDYSSPQYAAVLLPSVIAPYLADGSYNIYFPDNLLNTSNNPVAAAYENTNEKPSTVISAQGWIQPNFLPSWLTFKSTNSINYNLTRRYLYYNSKFGTGLLKNGQLTNSYSQRQKMTSSNLFTSKNRWNKYHNLTVQAGVEFENQWTSYEETTTVDFLTNNRPVPGIGIFGAPSVSKPIEFSLLSAISTADYSYRNRYYLSASYRMDASSRFKDTQRYGHFWSVSGAYRISNENWWKQIAKTTKIDYLRFRASYGVNGNLPSQYYNWQEIYSGQNYADATGAAQTYLPYEELTWEKNKIWNIGMDVRMFKDRIKFSIEYFDRKSVDLLKSVNISGISGFYTQLVNREGAGIHNRGLEMSISGTPLRTEKQSLNLNFNMGTLKSSYYGLETQEIVNTYQIRANGYPVYAFYARTWMGVNPETGQNLYLKSDGSVGTGTTSTNVLDDEGNVIGTITTPYSVVGQGLPKVTGGFSVDYAYGPFSISMLCSFAWGHHIFDRLSLYIISDGARQYNISTKQLDRWTPDNHSNAAPLRVNYSSLSTRPTRFLTKGDYLKVRNIKFQYTIPKPVASLLALSGASVFAQIENPIIFSHFKDYDPELSITGFRNTDSYPPMSTFILGLTLNF